MKEKFQFAIDRGGTFTDIYARCPGGKIRVMKLLSVDPSNYSDAPREGIRRIVEEETGISIPHSEKIDGSLIEWIRMGTTVATNALLERKGECMALLVTKGFKDILHIGNQARPKIFDLKIVTPEILYEEVVEVDCRVIPTHDGRCRMNHQWPKVTGNTGETFYKTKSLDTSVLSSELKRLKEKGISSIAVVLMHAYTYVEDELAVGELAKDIGFHQVSLSHQVMPMVRIVPRGFTACADAYLTPHIKKYVQGFASGFKDDLKYVNVLFMQSDGGLTPMNKFHGSRAVLSGPAGGVVGYALTTAGSQPVIGFDMGGTSTDVSRYAGQYEHVFESTTAGVTIQAPQLDVNTVAAGGGSCLVFRSGLFVVGPESAGAHPGPVCYRKGGPLTVTDANLALGRLLPEYFPKIFGEDEMQPLDKQATLNAFAELTDEINSFLASQDEGKHSMSVEEVAMGFIRVANEAMCRPIRALTQAKGYDTRQHVLACFGGAGAQHACAIARSLGMSKVAVHKYAGILSAYGMACADVVHEAQEPAAKTYALENFIYIDEQLSTLEKQCIDKLKEQGFSDERIVTEPFLHLRYQGTDCALMCSPAVPGQMDSPKHGDFKQNFLKRYQSEFGFTIPDRSVVVDDIRVRGVGKALINLEEYVEEASSEAVPENYTEVYFEGCEYQKTPIYIFSELRANHIVPGPAIIMDKLSTILVEPDCTAKITKTGDIWIDVGSAEQKIIGTELDAIQLSIFSHRFMSIAEQMGRVLQRTAISTNIKERLDFSCALFGPDGGLVSNAPHIPVHLGAMQETVQYQEHVLRVPVLSSSAFAILFLVKYLCVGFWMLLRSQHTNTSPETRWRRLKMRVQELSKHVPNRKKVYLEMKTVGNDLKEGDVILSNHPKAGGSHLPDLTVITPVFYSGVVKPVFFVASRGHHADIGGITPGSMPPHSKSLSEEGATFKSFFLVRGGQFCEQEVTEALLAPGKIPGCSGTRNLQDNLSDLKAQIAANQKGINLVRELIDVYSLDVVQAYMGHIQDNAEVAVQEMLREIGRKALQEGKNSLHATEYLDDGSPINLEVTIDINKGTAICDFSGTGPEVWGNCNAPRAITLSALIYCLRCMVGHDVPLNQGCLYPVKTIIPQGSLLDPSDNAAVVGGNVLTSQRIVDVIFKAFKTCAASQGCCNNVTFGQETWGYYETVAGGAGAGPTWHGHSGVHTHMTNTRITDPELLELRYPVVLQTFSLRKGSGGIGAYNGGDGVIREILFRAPVTLSVLTERRVFSPYGMEGGGPGAKGLNLMIRADGRIINLGSKTAINVDPGDVFQLLTPGGGAWGNPEDIIPIVQEKNPIPMERGSVFEYRMAQESV